MLLFSLSFPLSFAHQELPHFLIPIFRCAQNILLMQPKPIKSSQSIGNVFISIIAGIVFFISHATAQVPFTCEDQFFLTFTNDDKTSLNEVIIDPITNAVVFQSIDNNLNYTVNAIGYRSTDNFIYCIDPGTRNLIRIDATGNAQILKFLPLDAFTAYFAGDISPDGKYLVLIGTVSFTNGTSKAAELVKIDLEDPNYSFSVIPMNTDAQILDIAFHPTTDVLYGYDSNGQKLIRININTGAVTSPFPKQQAPVTTGSLFFDAYGNLFAYGSTSVFGDQNRLFEINPDSGVARLLIAGEAASSSDGCSCPYTVELLKTVVPEVTSPCSNVEYTFEFVNSSRRPHVGMRFEDKLPNGFTFVAIKDNPLNGNVLSQPGDDFFLLDNFNLPTGNHKLTIIVNVGDQPAGKYSNQAVLYNLPASLGSQRVSDNPKTLVKDDSTVVTIVALPFDAIDANTALCNGATDLRLDATQYSGQLGNLIQYSWPDGSDKSYFDVSSPGEYEVMMKVGCDSAHVVYNVIASDISVTLAQTSFNIALGDSIMLEATSTNTGTTTIYKWNSEENSSIRCNSCPETIARPFNDQTYTIQVSNELGCTDTAQARVVVQKDLNVYFPNVFTPGSSDNNGYFSGFGAPFTITERFAVYSRWGEKMFESKGAALNDPLLGWDGTFKGQIMQPGVYIWVADVLFLDGKKARYAGDVTLVR